ncbi:queuine tRNA-ribosyltransferase subunit QTRTD1 [Spatholobus suberectus]|nr:queuine tRNA-ribosyltransferase subunit QTRTD1 [Spatholobus suberectus]
MKILKMSLAEDKSHVVVVANIDNGCPPRSLVGRGSVGCSEIVRVSENERGSSVSECCVEVDPVPDAKVHLDMVKRNCRICHLSMDMTDHNNESGTVNPIELGCSCTEDLAAAHKHCAETWFKIKGNKICEISGSIASNVAGVVEVETTEHWNEANNDASTVPPTGPASPAETRHFWQSHRFLNFLLACMVFAFVISWLFHFNMPS